MVSGTTTWTTMQSSDHWRMYPNPGWEWEIGTCWWQKAQLLDLLYKPDLVCLKCIILPHTFSIVYTSLLGTHASSLLWHLLPCLLNKTSASGQPQLRKWPSRNLPCPPGPESCSICSDKIVWSVYVCVCVFRCVSTQVWVPQHVWTCQMTISGVGPHFSPWLRQYLLFVVCLCVGRIAACTFLGILCIASSIGVLGWKTCVTAFTWVLASNASPHAFSANALYTEPSS